MDVPSAIQEFGRMQIQRGVDGIGSVVGGERDKREGREGRVISCPVMARGVKDRGWF